ncbi:MAG: hypothetical protein A2W23_09975 [Planctomycetes bacterium RBG_16_43_13]|nr:MAG: hypothetical protein A2W23_09975 [Planctomycetes bacterium RBG_16_43_13]
MKLIKFALIVALLLGVAVLLLIPSPAPTYAAEVTLNLGSEYEALFFDARDINILLTGFERMLLPQLKAGDDSNIQISADRKNAFLKPGQTVYYVVKIKPEAKHKIDYTTFILKTVPTVTGTSLKTNYFTIKYIESIAGGTGLGGTIVSQDSTKGKAYQVISPAGEDLYMFSYTAVAEKAGGIRTTIGTHFQQGPGIIDISPNLLISGCNHTDKPLLCVPDISYNYWYGYNM